MNYFIYTDGSCKGNPGRGGWGWVEYNLDPESTHNNIDTPILFSDYGGELITTNNKMELRAVIEYLKSVLSDLLSYINNISTNSKLIIHSDSLYVIKSLVNNIEGEIKVDSKYNRVKYDGWLEGWKNKNFDKVKNKELWVELDDLINKIMNTKKVNIIFKHVKGHSISVGNNFADMLANKGADIVL